MQNPFADKIKDFPILAGQTDGKPFVYFDNAATTQKPRQVIEALTDYYETSNANPHRGVYALSEKATEIYESARAKTASFINAAKPEEIIFTRNSSEALNLISYSYGLENLQAGDEIVVTILEHHSNLLPWQMAARKTGAVLKYIYLNPDGSLNMDQASEIITSRTKIVAATQASNALGTLVDVRELAELAHKNGAAAVIDGSQSVPHMKVNVQDLGCDFMAFSGHKMFSSMGFGALYGKLALLERMPPFLSGGDMIEYVEEQSATFAPVPEKFEAGTQNVEGAAALSAAIDYINSLGIENIDRYERELCLYALEKMRGLDFVELYGPENRAPIISFNIKGVHPHDAATILDSYGICVRSGHHCAQPLMKYLGVNFTNRASFAFYNTPDEVDYFIDSLKSVRKWLGYGS
ncbi:MAG: cysteine desulfurase [Oscillospiraceae bacterium]|nr:cysteine desulfurase [Oscillospiraceae bacterium]